MVTGIGAIEPDGNCKKKIAQEAAGNPSTVRPSMASRLSLSLSLAIDNVASSGNSGVL
jgi:hypothetical protein